MGLLSPASPPSTTRGRLCQHGGTKGFRCSPTIKQNHDRPSTRLCCVKERQIVCSTRTHQYSKGLGFCSQNFTWVSSPQLALRVRHPPESTNRSINCVPFNLVCLKDFRCTQRARLLQAEPKNPLVISAEAVLLPGALSCLLFEPHLEAPVLSSKEVGCGCRTNTCTVAAAQALGKPPTTCGPSNSLLKRPKGIEMGL